MTSGSPLKGEEAKRIVQEKYPYARCEVMIIGRSKSYIVTDPRRGGAIQMGMKSSESAAWLSAAERIIKERKDSSDV